MRWTTSSTPIEVRRFWPPETPFRKTLPTLFVTFLLSDGSRNKPQGTGGRRVRSSAYFLPQPYVHGQYYHIAMWCDCCPLYIVLSDISQLLCTKCAKTPGQKKTYRLRTAVFSTGVGRGEEEERSRCRQGGGHKISTSNLNCTSAVTVVRRGSLANDADDLYSSLPAETVHSKLPSDKCR